jgi:hypothetical protein
MPEPIPQPGPETWLAARLANGLPAETWKPLPGWPHEVSDQGRIRTAQGRILSSRLNKDGYPQGDLYDPETKKEAKGVPVHWCVLTAHAGPRPDGKQASHLSGNPQWNWVPEGLAWEDQPTNERRKTSRPAPPDPTHPCTNAPACRNLVLHPGRNCRSCVAANGRKAAAMLNDGQPLRQVADHLGFTSRWVYQIAVEHGGYEGTPEQARGQRPALTGWRKRVARMVGAA